MEVAELLMRTTDGHRTTTPFPRDSGTLAVQRTYPRFPSPRPTRKRSRSVPLVSTPAPRQSVYSTRTVRFVQVDGSIPFGALLFGRDGVPFAVGAVIAW